MQKTYEQEKKILVKNTNNIKLISSENISKIFDIHKERKYDYSKILWSNLVLRLWLKKKGFIY